MLYPVYDIYKPFRNSIRSLNAEDALTVLWNYAEHFANNRSFDRDIEVLLQYRTSDKIRKSSILSEWEIELTIKEVLLNASRSRLEKQTKDLREWRTLARCVNKLKDLDNNLSKMYGSPENILAQLNRIAHNQFRFQMYQPSIMLLSRYLRLYKYTPLRDLFEQVIGLSPEDYFLIALAVLGFFMKRPFIEYPPSIEGMPEITHQKLDRVVSRISRSRQQLKEIILEHQDYSSRFMYAYNPLRAYPLVGMMINRKNCLFCPMTVLLAWRTTAGIYYDLVSDSGAFKAAFGDAFQSYVGDVLYKTNQNGSHNIMPEQHYKTRQGERRTVDWIIIRDEGALFVECKSKRLSQTAREEIEDLQALHKDLDTLTQAIIQTYKGIEEYKAGRYPQLGYKAERKLYPLVVTLEDWFFMGYPTEYVRDAVTKGLEKGGIDTKALDEMPYIVCSVQEFEILSQILQNRTLQDVFQGFTSNQSYNGWSLDSYLREVFSNDYDKRGPIFAEDFDALLPDRMR